MTHNGRITMACIAFFFNHQYLFLHQRGETKLCRARRVVSMLTQWFAHPRDRRVTDHALQSIGHGGRPASEKSADAQSPERSEQSCTYIHGETRKQRIGLSSTPSSTAFQVLPQDGYFLSPFGPCVALESHWMLDVALC